MLQSIQIKNLALAESVQMEFSPGLNVVTGETGAGKSIIIGALNLLLGERADKNIIREGTEQCSIEAVFNLAGHAEIDRLLQECGLPPCAESALVLRRILSAGGTGRQFVNDSPATLQVLKSIGDLLVDMHGPHDHQSLLKPDFQLNLLDAFARNEKMLSAYQAAFDEYNELLSRKQALQADGGNAPREIDMLTFQIRELEEAKLDENEEIEIITEHKTLANAERIIQLATDMQNVLSEADNSAFDRLVTAQQAGGELARLIPAAGEWQKETKDIAARIQELTRCIASFVQKIEADSTRLQSLDDRIALYQKLKNKYGGAAADLKKMLSRFKDRLLDLQNSAERLVQIDVRLKENRARLDKLGHDLSKQRNAASAKLAKAVQRHLQDLAFSHASFSVQFTAVEPQNSGLDRIEFVFSPNKGESEKSLRQIASNGEMSRVMLALKTILAGQDKIPVLIFDEIDENVGGQTAQVVGLKLAGLAGDHQVICITHLPQVAVHGRTQFAVRKKIAGARTVSTVFPLNNEERIEEIARMLGGKNLTSVTIRHAREMLEKAQAGGAITKA
ncbi:MAG: DNA repair protein RecN [Kiritimatiellia bacterium]|nr:DNA repair protein RecN [Kiritimatiellia bacterium]